MNHYPAFICEHGHIIEASEPFCNKKHCPDCGAPVICQCPECHSFIEGHPVGVSGYFNIPKYCTACGKPYPWVLASIEATTYLIQESELDQADQKKLIDVLPDVISETPKSQLAAFRFNRAISSAGKFLADGLRQFVIDFGCELLKKQLDL